MPRGRTRIRCPGCRDQARSTSAARQGYLFGQQTPQGGQIDLIKGPAVFNSFRSLKIHRNVAESPVGKQMTKRLQSHVSAADVCVAVHSTSLWTATVVEVKGPNPLPTDTLNQTSHGRPVLAQGGHRIPGGEHMARVKTHPQAMCIPHALKNRGQVLEPAAHRRPLSRRGFQQTDHLQPLGPPVSLIQRSHDPPQASGFTRRSVRAGVHNNVRNPQCFGTLQLHDQRVDRLSPKRRVRARQIDQVRSMRKRMTHLEFSQSLAKSPNALPRDLGRPPLTVVLGEDLNAIATRLVSPLDGLVEAAADRHVCAEDCHIRDYSSPPRECNPSGGVARPPIFPDSSSAAQAVRLYRF